MIKLNPEAFRSMSIQEFYLARDGYYESKGINTKQMKWSDVEKIMEEHGIAEKSYSIRSGVENG